MTRTCELKHGLINYEQFHLQMFQKNLVYSKLLKSRSIKREHRVVQQRKIAKK